MMKIQTGAHRIESTPDTGKTCACHSAPAQSPPASHSCGGGCRGIRTPRRIHAALGILLTAFLFLHLGVAASGWFPARYDAIASTLRHLSDKFPAFQAILLSLIGIQSLLGIRLLIRSGLRYKSARCRDDGQWRYFLQRWSAVILLAFLVIHLAMFKLRPVGSSFADASHHFLPGGSRFLAAFYILAMAGLAFHAGNGIWTGASVWNLREKRRGLWITAAFAVGTAIALLGFAALRAFAR